MQCNFLSQQDYYDQRFDLLKKAEGVVWPAYVDSKGIPTIGIGFNLRDHLNAVLRQFGVDVDSLSASDAKIVEGIRKAIQKTYMASDHTSLRNAIAPLFQSLSGNHRSSFSFNDDNEAKSFLNDVVAPQYESQLNTWLTENIPDLAYCSKERIALFSLCYNTKDGQSSLLGENLKNALLNGDRLRAWFEIRYKSNKSTADVQTRKGIANRRYAESDMFGLWNGTTPTQTELDNFTSFLDQNDPYGSNKSVLQLVRNYEADYNPHARTDINSSRVDETINSPDVKAYFVAQYAQGQTIDGNVILGTELNNNIIASTRVLTKAEIQKGYLKSTSSSDLILGGKGKDIIDGGAGNDVIYGGDGNDDITGGIDNDTLLGGANDDTYRIGYGEGNDTIIDTEGSNNKIIYTGADGKPHELKNFYSTGNGTNVWVTANGELMRHNSPWTITFEDGSTITLGEGSDPEDFGINLLDTPTDPTTTLTLTGDLAPLDDPPKYDALGNVIVDPNTPAFGRNDTLFGSAGDDRIEGMGGSDIIYGQGGSDWVLGGSGRDGISTGEGSDIIEGGTEGDLILGGAGDDQLFGESLGEMEGLVAAGEEAANIDLQGDLVSGQDGNDFIYGSNANDALFGGSGSDLLVGGGGNDIILSGTDASGALFTWTAAVDTHGGTAYEPVFTDIAITHGEYDESGNDAVYAGAGNDFVYAAGGDDEVYGGNGNDTIFGWGGSDYLFGEDGDDVIIGDNDINLLTADKHGDDYIDGGAGNDILMGMGGADNLFGGDGIDTLYGGDGNDAIYGEEGNDELYGQAGDDEIYGEEGNDWLQGDDNVAGVAGGNDYIDGGAGNDTILGVGGADEIYGGDGNDSLCGDASGVAFADQGNDYLDGEAGDDTIIGSGGNDTVYGGVGNDWLQGDAPDVAFAYQGNDYLDGGAGNDTILGYGGNDSLYGGDGNDWLQGDEGDDYIESGSGVSTMLGGAGNDTVVSGGASWLDGGTGDDSLVGGMFADTILGGAGADTIVDISGYNWLQGDDGDDYIEGGLQVDSILGGAGGDTIYGGDGNDLLHGDADDVDIALQGNDSIDGGAGNDTLAGGAGNDTLLGAAGDDELWGDEGNDSLAGGAGNDAYYYAGIPGNDVIDDLSTASAPNKVYFNYNTPLNNMKLTWHDDRLVIHVGSSTLELTNFDPNDPYGAHAVEDFITMSNTLGGISRTTNSSQGVLILREHGMGLTP
jgi:Ca2+-binding RTX toxin-like protein